MISNLSVKTAVYLLCSTVGDNDTQQ